MKTGDQMVRVDDGMRGVVELVEVPGAPGYAETRIVYIDRGERMIAGKREKWEPAVMPPRKLRAEEIEAVALAADKKLRAIDRNEPDKWWDAKVLHIAHDPELHRLITEYLSKRQ